MRCIGVSALFLLHASIFYGQLSKEDPTQLLVKKNRFYTGVNLQPALGFATHEGAFISDNVITPKVGFFLFNRFSLEVAANGIGRRAAGTHIFPQALNGEINLNYFPYTRKNILLYTITGLSYNEFTPIKTLPSRNTPDLKLGAGASFRFPKNPAFGINVELAYYIDPRNFEVRQNIPTISVGFTYTFPRKRSKTTPNSGTP